MVVPLRLLLAKSGIWRGRRTAESGAVEVLVIIKVIERLSIQILREILLCTSRFVSFLLLTKKSPFATWESMKNLYMVGEDWWMDM